MNKENLQDFVNESKKEIKEYLQEIPILVIGAILGDIGTLAKLMSIFTISTYTVI